MSAENILTRILLEVGLDKTTPQLSDADYEINQILNFMNAAGDDIIRRAEWSRLYKQWTVLNNVNEASLPTDFLKMVQSGAVKAIEGSGPTLCRSVSSPQQWEMLQIKESNQRFYHLSQGKIMFSPQLPATGASVRYVSKNWVVSKSEITSNDDEILIPERLVVKGAIWRWKRQKGLPFEDVLAEFEADLVVEIKADRGED